MSNQLKTYTTKELIDELTKRFDDMSLDEFKTLDDDLEKLLKTMESNLWSLI